MKKFFVIATISLLAACGQPAQQSDAPAPVTIPTGSFVGYGETPEFEFIADTRANAMALRVDGDTVASMPFAALQQNGEGAHVAAGDLTINLTPGSCLTHGINFPLNLTVQVSGYDALRGCAVERWDVHLTEMLPYIDACIATSPDTRQVSYARRDGDLVRVRLQGEVAFKDCSANFGTPQSATTQTMSETLKLPGDGAPIFVRGPGVNPGGVCYDAPEVRDAEGELLGWMLDPEGC